MYSPAAIEVGFELITIYFDWFQLDQAKLKQIKRYSRSKPISQFTSRSTIADPSASNDSMRNRNISTFIAPLKTPHPHLRIPIIVNSLLSACTVAN